VCVNQEPVTEQTLTMFSPTVRSWIGKQLKLILQKVDLKKKKCL